MTKSGDAVDCTATRRLARGSRPTAGRRGRGGSRNPARLPIKSGEIFTHVLAFSPGFAAPAEPAGRPRLFISHGTRDQVLPIDVCSRRIVPMVQRAGYDVRYREFDGGHTVPPEIVREALAWFRAEQG